MISITKEAELTFTQVFMTSAMQQRLADIIDNEPHLLTAVSERSGISLDRLMELSKDRRNFQAPELLTLSGFPW